MRPYQLPDDKIKSLLREYPTCTDNRALAEKYQFKHAKALRSFVMQFNCKKTPDTLSEINRLQNYRRTQKTITPEIVQIVRKEYSHFTNPELLERLWDQGLRQWSLKKIQSKYKLKKTKKTLHRVRADSPEEHDRKIVQQKANEQLKALAALREREAIEALKPDNEQCDWIDGFLVFNEPTRLEKALRPRKMKLEQKIVGVWIGKKLWGSTRLP